MLPSARSATAALAVLIILQLIMLMALFANSAPHPPATIAPFAIAPFLAASISVASAAIIIGPLRSGIGITLSVLAGLAAMLSYGPHKYFDPQFALIWPAVACGQMAFAGLLIVAVRSRIAD